MDDMTIDQAAKALGYSPGYIRKLVQRGNLAPSFHFSGRLVLFSPVEIARYAAERRPRGRPRRPKGDGADATS